MEKEKKTAKVDSTEALEKKLKREFGEIRRIDVPADDTGKNIVTGYIKMPDRSTLSLVMSKQDTDPIMAMEILLNTCWIGGDERLKTNDELFFGTVVALQSLIEVRAGVLKKI